MKGNLFFIRHGFTCANYVQHTKSWFQQFQRFLDIDTSLTKYEISKLKKLRPFKKCLFFRNIKKKNRIKSKYPSTWCFSILSRVFTQNK